MPRKQMNIRLDELTRETIKRIADRWSMSESQVITRGVLLLEDDLKRRAESTNDSADDSHTNKKTIARRSTKP